MSSDKIKQIVFPEDAYEILVAHCKRKFQAQYKPEERAERQAFGLIGGKFDGPGQVIVTMVSPLVKNSRYDEKYSDHVTGLMERIGSSSVEFPACGRGWVSDPKEVLAFERACDKSGGLFFGNYHMHTASGDRCTPADRELAHENGMWSFIMSMVDVKRFILRAYFEGRNEAEARIDL